MTGGEKRGLWEQGGMAGLVLALAIVSGCAPTVKAPTPRPVITKPVPAPSDPAPTDYYHAPGKARPRPYKVMGKWYYPLGHSSGFRQRGIASWYGKAFHGRTTSNGEIYNMYGVSAAHKILPLGTYVRVKNLKNGRSADLRINDRGPFVAGRIIDLSYGAARKLGIVGPGTAPVEVTALGVPARARGKTGTASSVPAPGWGDFTIQIGAFGERQNAEKLVRNLSRSYKNAHIRESYSPHKKKTLYRVLVGRCSSLKQAENYERILRNKGFRDAFAIAMD